MTFQKYRQTAALGKCLLRVALITASESQSGCYQVYVFDLRILYVTHISLLSAAGFHDPKKLHCQILPAKILVRTSLLGKSTNMLGNSYCIGYGGVTGARWSETSNA
jgi:hypothetical protein